MSIGDWDEGTLARFIEDAIQRDPLVALVRQLQGARKAGAGTVTFAAAVTSAATVVPHGLGVVPTAVVVTADNVAIFCDTRARTATQFSVVGYAPFGATTGTFGFTWVAFT